MTVTIEVIKTYQIEVPWRAGDDALALAYSMPVRQIEREGRLLDEQTDFAMIERKPVTLERSN